MDGLAGSPVTFLHTATAGAASGLSIVSGNDQTGPVSTELPLPLVVAVKDGGGNPVPAVAVSWVIGIGGGSVTPSTSTTDAAGQASAAWTLGSTPGVNNNTVSAVVSGIGVVEFSATATAGAPARLSIQTQPSASAVSGAVLGQQPVIQLLDAGGNAATQSGVTVQVAIATRRGLARGRHQHAHRRQRPGRLHRSLDHRLAGRAYAALLGDQLRGRDERADQSDARAHGHDHHGRHARPLARG